MTIEQAKQNLTTMGELVAKRIALTQAAALASGIMLTQLQAELEATGIAMAKLAACSWVSAGYLAPDPIYGC